jgi:hypothetical protein
MKVLAILGLVLVVFGVVGLGVAALMPADDFSISSAIGEEESEVPGSLSEQEDAKPVVTNIAEPDKVEDSAEPAPAVLLQPTTTEPSIPVALKDFLKYEVAFVSQAPFAVWDALHEEACEEASMIMVDHYFSGQPLNPHVMDQAIYDLVAWEEQLGYSVDLTAEEVQYTLQQYFELESEIITEVTAEKIIAELDKGNLVIAPAAGRDLANPYFTPPGPIFHMLLAIGYDKTKKEFIVNDPGTKNGKNFRYSFSNLVGAIADWNHALAADGMTEDGIRSGDKVVISVSGFIATEPLEQ